MSFATGLDPKSKPTALRRLQPSATDANATFSARQNPIAAGVDPLAPEPVLPPVPAYTAYQDALQQTPAFAQLDQLFKERIAFIDGAMGTMIQRYKLQVRRHAAGAMQWCSQHCQRRAASGTASLAVLQDVDAGPRSRVGPTWLACCAGG
ncbi:MAG: hypothetical protein ACT6UU_25080, partial [Hydrogenophaga sp.]